MIKDTEKNEPVVRFIDLQRIEIHWHADMEGANDPESFIIELNDVRLPVTLNDDKEAWDTRCIYEGIKQKTTLHLQQPIQFRDIGRVTLSTADGVRYTQGEQPVALHKLPITQLQQSYSRFTHSPSGILIKSTHHVDFAIHNKASTIIEIMLSKRPEIARKLVKWNAALAIYGLEQDAYDIPEHRGGADFLGYTVEGFGGMPSIPVTSVSEKNILRILDGPYQTKYKNESILAHEFAHAIHLIGINNLEDQTLANQFLTAYEHAVENQLWPKTYAISNYEEYFATLSTIWFNVMAESQDGSWDGVRGPINTREELKAYDPVGYTFFDSIYSDQAFPAPWNETPNHFTI